MVWGTVQGVGLCPALGAVRKQSLFWDAASVVPGLKVEEWKVIKAVVGRPAAGYLLAQDKGVLGEFCVLDNVTILVFVQTVTKQSYLCL